MRHRVAVLGAGVMGRLHVRVLSQLEARFEVVGAFDPCSASAEEVASRWGVGALAHEAEAVAAAELLVVASPIAAHAATVRRALAAGRSVLVEKPLCARADEAFALARAPRAGQWLFVGHSERFNPVVRAIRRLVDPGRIVGIDLTRIAPARTRSHGRAVLLSLGVHDLDLAAYITGGPVTLREAGGCRDAWARLVLESARGAAARVYVDRTGATRKRSLEVTTDRELLSGDLLAPRLFRTCLRTGRTSEVPLATEEPLAAQALAVASAMDGRPGKQVATGLDGARALALVELAEPWLAAEASDARVSEAV